MGTPYIGEIRMFAGNFAPQGWLMCDGSLQSIAENDVLFSLIGTTYGGDGQTTFGLPDLRGRVPVHNGQGPGLSNYVLGQSGGQETVTLSANQIPVHTHNVIATSTNGTQTGPGGAIPAGSSAVALYNTNPPQTNLAPQAVKPDGQGQPHTNFQPYLCINFIIAQFGIYPSPT